MSRGNQKEDSDGLGLGGGLALAAGAVGLGALLYGIFQQSEEEPQRQEQRPSRPATTAPGGNSWSSATSTQGRTNPPRNNNAPRQQTLREQETAATIPFQVVADQVLGNNGNNASTTVVLCPVCRRELGQRIMTLPCHHVLHGECLTALIQRNPSSPSCCVCNESIY